MLTIMFYGLLIYGLVIAINPLINILLLFIRDTWDKYIEWDKKRIKNWMDAYHRGEDNYEHYDPDTWNKEIMKADYPDYDKYDDPFYIGDDEEEMEEIDSCK